MGLPIFGKCRQMHLVRGIVQIYYRVIALISVNIVPSWDIEGRELASIRRYPNDRQYSPISVQKPFYYIAINILYHLQ